MKGDGEMTKKGTAVFIKRERGFGFIRDTEDKRDYFFPANELLEGDFDNIQVGDVLTFTATTDHMNRPKAIEIKIVEN